MDNASKALVMAGAIMIAVLIISLGVYLVNLNRDPIDNTVTAIDAKALSTYNNRFTKYEGYGRSASEVLQLFSTIDQHNNNSEELFNFPEISKTGITKKKDVDSFKKYKILFEYDGRGAVNGVSISVDS